MTAIRTTKEIAVLIPCHNEEHSVESVVKAFQSALTGSQVFVYDNCSTDRTAEVASAAGACVRHAPEKGKGNVVRQMFADVDADIYVLVDGDGQCDPGSVVPMIRKLREEHLDMVVGARHELAEATESTYRPGHRWGNRLLTESVRAIFGGAFTDMLSGYRIFSRRFVKSFPALSRGFEIETELTVHALELRMPWGEIHTEFRSRAPGSESKLSTFRDGWRILSNIVRLFVSERPLMFYGVCSAIAALVSVGLAIPLIITFLETSLVPRFPTAILCAALMICSLVALACGLILDNVVKGRQEMKRLAYLAIPR